MIDFFPRTRIVPAPYTEALRGYVVPAFVDRNRQEEPDAASSRAFAELLAGIRELYIHSGAQTGARQGDLFLVCEEVPVGGVTTRRKIGKLRVNEVENPAAARCRITKGAEAIAEALADGRETVCIRGEKAFGY